MLMPGRKGYQSLGGWAGGCSKGGSSLPADLSVKSRTAPDPTEYKASNEIEFITLETNAMN